MSASIAWQALQQALTTSEPACRDDSRFLNDGRADVLRADLATVCRACPILVECRTYATLARPHNMGGFWAGRWRGKPTQHA